MQQIPVPYGSMLHIPLTSLLLLAAKQKLHTKKTTFVCLYKCIIVNPHSTCMGHTEGPQAYGVYANQPTNFF